MIKKLVAVLATAAILCSTLPFTAIAGEINTESEVTNSIPQLEATSEESQNGLLETFQPENSTVETQSPELFEETTTASPENQPAGDNELSSDQTGENGEAGDAEVIPTPSPEENDQPLFGMYLDEHIAYVSGSEDRVNPDAPLSRSEAASLIYQLLTSPVTPSGNHFSDVSPNAWYGTFVNSLTEMGILSGKGENSFEPQSNITRAEFASILSKLFPLKTEQVTFSDVGEDHWAFSAIQNAAARSWVSGYPDGTFRPDSSITRAEAFAMMNKMLGRSPDIDRINAQRKFLRFVDLPYDYWAYYHIMEASIPHDHSYDEEGNEIWETYTLPTAQLGRGPHLIGGELYYIGNDGYYVRNSSVGVLQFNNEGQYTTGDARLDAKLTSIVLQEGKSTESLYSNLRLMYNYVIDDYSYLALSHIPQGTSGWEISYATSMIDRKRGNCYSYAALFSFLARKLGYQATAVSGMVTVNTCPTWTYGSWSEHGWVEIKMDDGVIYVCDPQLRDGHAAQWGYNWDLFMKPYGQGVAHYRINNKILS